MPIKNVIVYSQTLPPEHVGGIETNAYHLIRYLEKEKDFYFTVFTATKKKVLFRKQANLNYGGLAFNVKLIKKKVLKKSGGFLTELQKLKYKPEETVIYHNSLDLYNSYGVLKKAGYYQVARSGGNDLSFLQRNAGNSDVFCKALSHLDKLFVNSNFSFERASKIGIPAEVLQVVKGGCEIDSKIKADRSKLSLTQDKPIILSCGRLVDFKGLDDAVEALSLIIKQGFDPLFVVVGQGALEFELKQKAKQLGVSNNCLFVGKVEPSQMQEYYQIADLYLSSSKDIERVVDGFRYVHTETMGRSICEAQGCGVPVVSTDAGGASEMVLDGVSGVVVPQGEPQAMAKAVANLLSNPGKRQAFAKGALNHARKNLSWDAVLSQYVCTMKSLN